MLRNDLIKNKIYGIIFIILGALTIPIEWDATFFLDRYIQSDKSSVRCPGSRKDIW